MKKTECYFPACDSLHHFFELLSVWNFDTRTKVLKVAFWLAVKAESQPMRNAEVNRVVIVIVVFISVNVPSE